MGLDMYLERTIRVEGLDDEGYGTLAGLVSDQFSNTEDAIKALQVSTLPGAREIIPAVRQAGNPKWFTYPSIFEEVGYWRKANQIHNWFVEKVQGGADECQYSVVSQEQLEELLGIVKSVLEDPEQASELLPTTSGFFFGSTDYDEEYLSDLKDTVTILERVLKETDFEKQVVLYRASW